MSLIKEDKSFKLVMKRP